MSINHDDVARLWALQSKRDARGFNVFYVRDTIYSYGSHFPIARHVRTADGSRAILFNSRGYSVSTAKHKGIVHRAIRNHAPSARVFYVETPSAEPSSADVRAKLRDARDELVKASRARSRRDDYIEQAASCLSDAREFIAAFAVDVPADLSEALDSAESDVRRESLGRRDAA